jgi:hypothetical protein
MSRHAHFTHEIGFWLGAMTDCELAYLAKTLPGNIGRWRRALGIRTFPIRRTVARDKEIRGLLFRTQNAAAVAKRFGLSRERVRAIAEAGGVRRRWVQE